MMNNFRHLAQYIRHYPLTSVEVLAIWIVCMIPIPETPLDHVRFIDKWTHFVMFGSLTIVIWWEYLWRHSHSGKEGIVPIHWSRLLKGGLLCPVIMGGLIELAQAYLTTCRSGDWLDFFCDAIGAMLGAVIACVVMTISKK